MPMIHGISAKWAPPNERGRLVGFVLGGKLFYRLSTRSIYMILNAIYTILKLYLYYT